MFAIGDRVWPGVSKLVEEIGELGQVLGKLMGSRGNIHHWSGNLRDKLHEEIGDVLGAIRFVIIHGALDPDVIEFRARKKYEQFEKWHREDPEYP
jgi:NTP pyrophosphatase (non-canonical NTP hydrolase)